MGLTGYYHRFVKNYGKIAAPPTQLLKKDGLQWGEEVDLAVIALKEAMREVPTLALPNLKEEFTIEADASGIGIWAFVTKRKTLAFFSQTFSDRARQKLVYERELIAIVLAVQK